MQSLSYIDETLRLAADAKEVPGVVAVAATDKEIIYQGAFGKRDLGKRDLGKDAPMTADSVFWIASMTKAITCTAAMQLVEQGKLNLDEPIAKILPELAAPKVLEGFDEKGRAEAARCQAAHHAKAAYDPYGGFLLRHLERRHGQAHGASGNPRDHHLREQGTDRASRGRAGREVGVRRQHRLRRQGRGGRERQEARRLS